MMTGSVHALTFDIGTTGLKTCLFSISDTISKIDAASARYDLSILPGGGAEQDPQQWWEAMVATTRELIQRNPEAMANLAGISFCAQMQAMVMVDKDARPVHNAFSYMDQRAGDAMRARVGRGVKVAGVNAGFAVTSLRRTGAVSASVKDPVWKYLWLKDNEPEEFARGHKWLDVKESLVARMTGEFVMSTDSAFATLLLEKGSTPPRFDPVLMKQLGVDPDHMPRIVAATDVVGPLNRQSAQDLGLPEGVPVYAGGGDATLIGVGAGASTLGDTHVYMGTSGWVSTVTDKQVVDVFHMIAALVGARPNYFNYFAELETAGKCLEWVHDHLALDEINVYLEKKQITEDSPAKYASLYDYLSEVISTAEPGSGGVVFAPWLHGNRSPFEDPNARGMFLGISLDTGKTELLRAVIEGVAMHMRWFVELHDKKVGASHRVRFVGGGARSAVTSQILADVLQRPVDVVAEPQDVGAVGAAVLVAVGEGLIQDLGQAARLIEVEQSFEPNQENKAVYDRNYSAFQRLHRANKSIFQILAQG